MATKNEIAERQQFTKVYQNFTPSEKAVLEATINLIFALLASRMSADIFSLFASRLSTSADIAATQKQEG